MLFTNAACLPEALRDKMLFDVTYALLLPALAGAFIMSRLALGLGSTCFNRVMHNLLVTQRFWADREQVRDHGQSVLVMSRN
jgi:hypothetical protein